MGLYSGTQGRQVRVTLGSLRRIYQEHLVNLSASSCGSPPACCPDAERHRAWHRGWTPVDGTGNGQEAAVVPSMRTPDVSLLSLPAGFPENVPSRKWHAHCSVTFVCLFVFCRWPGQVPFSERT